MNTPFPGAVKSASPPLPLYLTGRGTRKVERDGPALLVRRVGAASSRYPLARLSRVISAAHVQWEARAIAACLEHNLPIVFLNPAGEPAGYLHAVRLQPSPGDELIHELLDRPDGVERYTLWVRGERGRVMSEWRSRTAWSVDEGGWRDLLRRYVYLGEDPLRGVAGGGLLRSVLFAQVLERLRKAGLGPLYWGVNGEPVNLTDDITGILVLALGPGLHSLGGRMWGEAAALLTLWHAMVPEIDTRLAALVGRLHRFLQETLDEWR